MDIDWPVQSNFLESCHLLIAVCCGRSRDDGFQEFTRILISISGVSSIVMFISKRKHKKGTPLNKEALPYYIKLLDFHYSMISIQIKGINV